VPSHEAIISATPSAIAILNGFFIMIVLLSHKRLKIVSLTFIFAMQR
jgi:hypothetical protein